MSSTGCRSVGELAITPQDLACRRLLLERLPRLAEQPRVLDRDRRLAGESGDELDLRGRERLDALLPQRDHADHDVVAHDRHAEHRAEAPDPLRLWQAVLAVGENVLEVDGLLLSAVRPTSDLAAGPHRVLRFELAELRRHAAVVDCEAIHVAVEAEDEPLLRPAQAGGALDERAQHRVEAERRAADRLEQLAHRRLFGGLLGELSLALLELGDVAGGPDHAVGAPACVAQRDAVLAPPAPRTVARAVAVVALEPLGFALEVRHERGAESRQVVGVNAVQERRRRSQLLRREPHDGADPVGVVDRAAGDVPVVDALVDRAASRSRSARRSRAGAARCGARP